MPHSTVDTILAILTAHSGHDLARLVGFTLIAQTLDAAGQLRNHSLSLRDQSDEDTDALLETGRVLRGRDNT